MSDQMNVEIGHEPNNDSPVSRGAPGKERTERNVRSSSEAYNAGTMQKQLIHEEYNSAWNHHVIAEAFRTGRARDIADEPKVEPGTAAFVIGSGPSLDDALHHLKNWKGGIFCTTSHALTFMRYGIEPTHIVNLDPFSCWDEIDGIDWSRTRTKLVTHPGTWPDLVEKWPNEMLLYRQNIGRLDSFYATTQKRQYTWREGGRDEATFHFMIKTDVTQFACSPPAQMFIADRLGYGPIFLSGVDFGYHSGKDRFTSYTVATREKTIVSPMSKDAVVIPTEWEEHIHQIGENVMSDPDVIVTNNGLLTHPVHLYYKKNMLSAWRLSLQDVWTTDHGIITEMPYIDIKKVVKKQGRGFRPWPKDRIKNVTEDYLASVGAFIVESDHGVNFVESADPETELPQFMAGVNRQYACTKCGNLLIANDNEIHNGEACPVCGAPIIQRNPMDIEKNMERIRHRIERAKK